MTRPIIVAIVVALCLLVVAATTGMTEGRSVHPAPEAFAAGCGGGGCGQAAAPECACADGAECICEDACECADCACAKCAA